MRKATGQIIDNKLSYDLKLLEEFESQRADKLKEMGRLYSIGGMYELLSFLFLSPLICIPLILVLIILEKFGLIRNVFLTSEASFIIVMVNLLVGFLVIKISWRKVQPKIKEKFILLSEKLDNIFHPFEVTALICFRLSKLMDKYSRIKTQFTTGDAEVSDSLRNYKEELSGSHQGNFYVSTNSFFINIYNENDIRNKLAKLNMPKSEISKDLCSKLNFINEFISSGRRLSKGDFRIGSTVFGKLAEAFVFAFDNEFNKFSDLLGGVVKLIEQYKQSKAPLFEIFLISVYFSQILVKNYKFVLFKAVIILICFFTVALITFFLFIFLPRELLAKIPILYKYGLDEDKIRWMISAASVFVIPIYIGISRILKKIFG